MQSQSSVNLADILLDPPTPHLEDGKYVSMRLTTDALKFILENVDKSCATLETGCGLSTVVFALTGARHVSIAPIADEFEVLKKYCLDRDIPTAQIDFIAAGSQSILPTLDVPPLDLVLIDGCHGFPAPYIDWFYTAGKMKKGGHVIIDDTWVWSCEILRDFLAEQRQWKFVTEYEHRTAIFEKLEDGSEWLEWTQQPFVARSGRLSWVGGQMKYVDPDSLFSAKVARAFSDLKEGNFKALREKVARRLSRALSQ